MQQGRVFLSCGHEDPDKTLGWAVHYADYSDEDLGKVVIVSGTYCSRCTAVRLLLRPENTWFDYEEAKEAIFGKT